MTVTSAVPRSADSIFIEVGIVYSDDGHLAEEATVRATFTGPDGETIGPIDLARSSGGAYGTEVTVPEFGEWSIAISSENPTAIAETTVTMTGPTTTTSAPPTTTTTAAPTTTSSQPEVTTTMPGSGESASLPMVPILVGGTVVGVGIGLLRRFRR